MTIVLCVIMAATSCPQTLNESVAYRRKYRPFILALEGSLQFAQCRSFRRYFPQPCIPDKSFPSHSVSTAHAFRNPCIIYSCFSGKLLLSIFLFSISQNPPCSPSTLFVFLLWSSFITLAHSGSEEFYYG